MSGAWLRWLLSLPVWGGAVPAGDARLTVVRHHRVYAASARPLYRLGVTGAVLEAQIATCVSAGLTPITVEEGLAWLDSGARGWRVAFSFDDGYRDNLEVALPLLERHGARATLYLATGLMRERRAPWWDELAHVLTEAPPSRAAIEWGGVRAELALERPAGRSEALRALLPLLRVPPSEQRQRLDDLRHVLRVGTEAPCELATLAEAARWAEAGMELGAHTRHHPFLSLLDEESQREEIAGSAADIRDGLGARVTGLAYPNGDHDGATIRAVRAAGLAYAVTTRSGDIERGSERFTLPRRGLPEGAVLGPRGRFSARMTHAELAGRFDRMRAGRSGAST